MAVDLHIPRSSTQYMSLRGGCELRYDTPCAMPVRCSLLSCQKWNARRTDTTGESLCCISGQASEKPVLLFPFSEYRLSLLVLLFISSPSVDIHFLLTRSCFFCSLTVSSPSSATSQRRLNSWTTPSRDWR